MELTHTLLQQLHFVIASLIAISKIHSGKALLKLSVLIVVILNLLEINS